MKRKILISCENQDIEKAIELESLLLAKSKSYELDGKYRLQSVVNEQEERIRKKLQKKIRDTTVTIVLIGQKTKDSQSVKWEIDESLLKNGEPNGVLAIKISPTVFLPDDSIVGSIIKNAGAEIVDWELATIEQAVKRAIEAAKRASTICDPHLPTPPKSCNRQH